MDTNTGLKDRYLSEVAKVLGVLLADEYVLYTKTRNAHWNVIGKDFHSMHLFFESQYNELADVIDAVAERMRMLDHYAPATLREYLELTRLTERTREKNYSEGFIIELLDDHQSIIFYIREHIERINNDWKDIGTGDYLTGLIEYHEKMAWMLRSHLL